MKAAQLYKRSALWRKYEALDFIGSNDYTENIFFVVVIIDLVVFDEFLC